MQQQKLSAKKILEKRKLPKVKASENLVKVWLIHIFSSVFNVWSGSKILDDLFEMSALSLKKLIVQKGSAEGGKEEVEEGIC